MIFWTYETNLGVGGVGWGGYTREGGQLCDERRREEHRWRVPVVLTGEVSLLEYSVLRKA